MHIICIHTCVLYIYIYIHTIMIHLLGSLRPGGLKIHYTQFAIQDSRLFGPNPWKIVAPPSNYLSKKRFLGNPILGTNLGSRILAMRTGCIL